MEFSLTRCNVRRFLSAIRAMGVESYAVNNHGIPTLTELHKTVRTCHRCGLADTRRNVVFGEGNSKARLVFVGEAPGEEEDLHGRPFVGRAGKVLDQLIERVGLRREDVYICNVLKCRPPQNRDPQETEIDVCRDYLFTQLDLIRPKIICTLGRHAYNTLLGVDERITRIRGVLTRYKDVMLLPTYHPSFLLRNQGKIRDVWEDMDHLKRLLKT
jgi:uracil-DNA glycosylase